MVLFGAIVTGRREKEVSCVSGRSRAEKAEQESRVRGRNSRLLFTGPNGGLSQGDRGSPTCSRGTTDGSGKGELAELSASAIRSAQTFIIDKREETAVSRFAIWTMTRETHEGIWNVASAAPPEQSEMSIASRYLTRRLLTCPIGRDILSRGNRQLPLLFRLPLCIRRQPWWTIFVWRCLDHFTGRNQGDVNVWNKGGTVGVQGGNCFNLNLARTGRRVKAQSKHHRL